MVSRRSDKISHIKSPQIRVGRPKLGEKVSVRISGDIGFVEAKSLPETAPSANRHLSIWRAQILSTVIPSRASLIVLSGGAGSGKSSTALQIASAFSDTKNGTYAWVKCHPGLTSLDEFSRTIVDDVSHAIIHRGAETKGRMPQRFESLQHPAERIFALGAAREPMTIVLDDYHLASSKENDSWILELVESGEQLCIVITTRVPLTEFTNPISALRISIIEIPQDMLHFSVSEIRQLLRLRQPSAFKNSKRELEIIANEVFSHTEGWPGAVHAISIGSPIQQNHFDLQLSQKSFFTMIETWINTLDSEVRIAVCASALPSESSTTLIAKVCELDATQTRMLFECYNTLGAIFTLDESNTRWYRHQRLVRIQLLTLAKQVLSEDNHFRLLGALSRALKDSDPLEAARLALQAGQWNLLNEIVNHHPSCINLTSPADSASFAFQEIPHQVTKSYPALHFMSLLAEIGSPHKSKHRLITSSLRFLGNALVAKQVENPARAGMHSALKMGAARMIGREAQSLTYARKADVQQEISEVRDKTESAELKCLISEHIAITYLVSERFHESASQLERLSNLRQTAAPNRLPHQFALQAFVAAWRGDLRTAKRSIEAVTARTPKPNWFAGYEAAGFHVASALLELEDANWRSARRQLDSYSEMRQVSEFWPQLTCIEALIIEAQDGPDEALNRLTWLIESSSNAQMLSKTNKALLDGLSSRLAWRASRTVPIPGMQQARTVGHVISQLSYGRSAGARSTASEILRNPSTENFPRRKCKVLLLHAESARCMGELEIAQRSFKSALALAGQYRLTLPFRVLPDSSMDALTNLINSRDTDNSQLVTETRGLLSTAEVRALSSILKHGSIALAATNLHLSPHTVKNQVRSAYRKLGVNKRSDAIAAAIEAGYQLSG